MKHTNKIFKKFYKQIEPSGSQYVSMYKLIWSNTPINTTERSILGVMFELEMELAEETECPE